MTDLGIAAQRAAEERLEACYDELSKGDDEFCEDDDGGEFCGCITCIVRTVLEAAVPILFGVREPE